ncbi:MAG: alpha/beta hydrolase [Acidimicrobiia bacterium]|nr:MAG: alpha/beta hydrolase [Acidimicrobiia bacterium]
MRIDVNGTGIEVDEGGTGEAVLLLHGWPDTHALWDAQVGALRAAGHRTIAPDLRGFGGSDKPAEVDRYAIPFLAGDVLGVLDHFGVQRAHVVGHDWGAAIAWAIAAFAPERVASLAALSVGHPGAFVAAGYPQREKSWYMLLFQFRDVAEEWLSRDDFRNFREWSGHPAADEVAARLADRAALTASLAPYRANLPPEALVAPPTEFPPVSVPTMGVWGSEDFALTEAQMRDSERFVTGPFRYERLDGVGHWMTLEAPGRVNELLCDFLAAPS